MDDGHNNTPVCCCNIHNKGAQLLLQLCSYFYGTFLYYRWADYKNNLYLKSLLSNLHLKSSTYHLSPPKNIFMNMWCSVTITHRVFTGDYKEGPWEPWLWLQRFRRAPGEGRLRQHDPPPWPRRAGRVEILWSHPSGTARKLWDKFFIWVNSPTDFSARVQLVFRISYAAATEFVLLLNGERNLFTYLPTAPLVEH